MQIRSLILTGSAVVSLATGSASAQEVLTGQIDTHIGPIALQNGYPNSDSVKKLYDEIDFQRATQAYIWATPIVAMEALRRGNLRDAGVTFKVITVNDAYITPVSKILTGNDTIILGASFVDLGRDGPIVVDVPLGVYGVVDDWWQRPIVEVGPFGSDKGKGGKFLLLPRDYSGKVPDGYFPATSRTNRAMFFGWAFVKDGDVTAAADTLARIKVYPLSQADNPPANRVVRIGRRPMDTISPRGLKYWEFLADALNHEPVEERDRFFHAMLKPLGIEKGKPFQPDERQRRILINAETVGFLMTQTISMAPRLANASSYRGTHWKWVLTLDPSQETANYSQLDERTDYTFEAITTAQSMVEPIVGAGSQSMSSAKDKNGAWLDGGKDYVLHVPTNVPAKEFWAVTAYDVLTRSMIATDTMKAGISSKDGLKVNADRSFDIQFGPQPPRDGGNWIKTIPGRGWFVYFRWYSPTEAFFDKSWTLPDIENLN